MVVYTGPRWSTATRGVLALLFGLLAIALPGLTLLGLAIVFGVYAVVGGVVAAVAASRSGARGPYLWEAVVLIVTGLLTLSWPDATVLVLVIVPAIWSIVSGLGQLGFASRALREHRAAWLVFLSGAFGVLFGILVLARPGAGVAAIAFLIGLYAILHGVMLLALTYVSRNRDSAGTG
ncbi:HdeD family acid-resistance protein [Actinokineospora enzanensis]|uniref:HdeD family acid-resistance protein n=1 Tax=Actinokineospora enzanensis TaxID=155975 RepID=UPI00037DD837|nr:DUF308 domain-containing protein [Actinokineospora enzanensis]